MIQPNLNITEIKVFVPTEDFALSKRFYVSACCARRNVFSTR